MIILGKDGKQYATVKECQRADVEYDRRIADEKAQLEAKKIADEKAIAERKAEISKRKKELSSMIESAEDKVKVAKVDYNQARAQAEKIIAEAKKEAQAILDAAGEKLKLANEEKVNAISNFNKEFGPFTTVLTGEDAWNEYQRIQNNIDRQFNAFKSIFNWF